MMQVLEAARQSRKPIRIGVNAGSLDKKILKQYDGITAEGLVESALEHVRLCESVGFEDLVVSIKASDVPLMIEANRLFAEKTDYPIHLGVTEAGIPKTGIVRSAVGIGTLLAEGIGDTLRVSLTGDPLDEIRAGFDVLKALRLRQHGLTLISCPTCGRLESNLVPIVVEVEKRLASVKKTVTIAIMGCAVNGPGEAREADLGIALGKGKAVLFKKGEIVRKIETGEIVRVVVDEVLNWPD
jgi:(E)-4-hydroxy-3-methylbut-2-enyl-diphosphate synthase